jgi:hypothetical protein
MFGKLYFFPNINNKMNFLWGGGGEKKPSSTLSPD